MPPKLSSEVPLLDETPTDKLVVGPGPDEDEVTRIISEEAYCFTVDDIPGVCRYDGTRVASNDPTQDRFIHGRFPPPWKSKSEWITWGIFDGHGGWETADVLEKQLLRFVRSNLVEYEGQDSVPDMLVRAAIMRGFMELDDCLVKSAKTTVTSNMPSQDKVKRLALGFVGSCALLSIYDPGTRNLHVACTGNSRAVLVSEEENPGEWSVEHLSEDQTGYNQSEVLRLGQEHPYEPNMIRNGRLYGLEVTRAFGDGTYKWSLPLASYIGNNFGMRGGTANSLRTPPYVGAGPKVTSTNIDPTRISFMIMASDGFWERITTRQAAKLVVSWLKFRTRTKESAVKYEPELKPTGMNLFNESSSYIEEGPPDEYKTMKTFHPREISSPGDIDVPPTFGTDGASDDNEDRDNADPDEMNPDNVDPNEMNPDNADPDEMNPDNVDSDDTNVDDMDLNAIEYSGRSAWGFTSEEADSEVSMVMPDYPPFNFSLIRAGMPLSFVEARTTVEDDNAAVHLIRNVLGGKYRGMIASQLAFNNGNARHIRDDITVQVVFFNTPFI
ncbi:phosphatase 2C-like domain-containing protein [Xylaria sp. FL1777]|nr:phosphatase 2C-like domain-containing protein [Xylaria sp. FL1777]